MSLRVVLALSALLCLPAGAASQEVATAPDRGGFTLLLNLGLGLQHDAFIGTTETGLGGINLGIGGFIQDDLALLFRVSGTNVDYSGTGQVSGVGGPTIQYWMNDRASLEAGVGIGFWDIGGVNDTGLGIMLGAGYAFFQRGKHNLSIGIEYAPAFTDPATVHNVGIVFGWQLL